MEYDVNSKILRIKKSEDSELPVKPLDFLKHSYEHFRTTGIFEVMKDYEAELREKTNMPGLMVNILVGKLVTGSPRATKHSWGESYYPVILTIKVPGGTAPIEKEFLRIPFMDKTGCLYFGKTRKVMFGELVNEENISSTTKTSKTGKFMYLNVVGATRSFEIGKDISKIGKAPFIRIFGKNEDYLQCMEAFNYRDGVDIDPYFMFSNPNITYRFGNRAMRLPDSIEKLTADYKPLQHLGAANFKVHGLRKALNERLTIDKAVGYFLSRDVVLQNGSRIAKGTLVTEQLIRVFKRNLVNELYIRVNIRELRGSALAENITITKVPKGTKVTAGILEKLPSYAGYAYLPDDVTFKEPIMFEAGNKLWAEDIDLLYDCGFESIKISVKDAKDSQRTYTQTFRFEQEIIGNGTCRLCDFRPGEKSTEYVYYKGVEDPFNCEFFPDSDYLTAWDLMALVSMLGRTISMPELAETFDRDRDFLKTVNFCGEVFERCLRTALSVHLNAYRNKLIKYFNGENSAVWPYVGVLKMWYGLINETGLIQQPKDVNPLALLDQASAVQIERLTGDSNPAPEQRYMAQGQFGRICAYNTPAGKKTGLVTAMALGGNVIDGKFVSYFLKVVKVGKKYKLDKTPVPLSAFECMKFTIASRCDLTFDSEGFIVPTTIQAFVPAPWSETEKVRPEEALSTEVDYVTVNNCQHMSPAAAAIPFADCDDPIRVQFGIHLMSQCIYVQNGEIPYVATSMYETVYDYTDSLVYKAEYSGEVIDVTRNKLVVEYDEVGEHTISFFENVSMYDLTVSVNVKFGVGARFKKGDILIDSPISQDGIFSPGINPLAAYMTWEGHNYDDGITISKLMSQNSISISTETVERKESLRSGTPTLMVDSKSIAYYKEGDAIATITRNNGGGKSPESEAWRTNTSGILYGINSEIDGSKRIYKANFLKFSAAQKGDKLAGRHANKGTINLVERNGNMPILMNGEVVELLLNPTGVPSRMNIGQIWDAQLGLVAKLLGVRIISEAFQGASEKDVRILLQFVWDLANLDDFQEICRRNSNLPNELLSQGKDRMAYLRQWRGCFNPDGTAPVYNPKTGKMFPNPVLIGYPYFLKIHKEVDDAMHSRAGGYGGEAEPYQQITGQPVKGAKNGGGQKYGEMEFAALLAHGASKYTEECSNGKSDNIGMRLNYLCESLHAPPLCKPEETCPRTADLFRYDLECFAVRTDIENYLDIDAVSNNKRFKYRGSGILSRIKRDNETKDEESDTSDAASKFCAELFSGDI